MDEARRVASNIAKPSSRASRNQTQSQGVQQFVRHGGNGGQARVLRAAQKRSPPNFLVALRINATPEGPAHFQLDGERVNYFS